MNSEDFEQGRTAVRDRIKTPDFSSVRTAGTRRRSRQRLGGVAALVTAAVLAGVTVASGGAGLAPAGPSHDLIAAQPWPMTTRSSVSDQFPVDGRQGYAVLNVDDKNDGSGRLALAHTADAGKTWKAWLLPSALAVLKRGELVITPMNGKTQPPVPQAFRFLRDPLVLDQDTVLFRNLISTDGGQSWSVVPAGYGAKVAAVPPGWPLLAGDDNVLAAMDPDTGQLHPLAHQPSTGVDPPVTGDRRVLPAADGSLWVAGSHQESHPSVAVSRDGGRTWSTRAFTGLPQTDHVVTSRDGRTGYVVLAGPMGGSAKRAVTTNGGATWSEPATITKLTTPVGLAVAADGTLLSTNIGSAWGPGLISRDGGLTFTDNPAVPSTNGIVRTPAGGYVYLSTGPISAGDGIPDHVSYSSDGKTFTLVPLPPNAH